MIHHSLGSHGDLMKTVILDGKHLTLEEVLEVAEGKAVVKIASSVTKKVRRSREFIEKALDQGEFFEAELI
jgi:histidine ammonia-lyase